MSKKFGVIDFCYIGSTGRLRFGGFYSLLFTDAKDRPEIINKVKDIASKNGYPVDFTKKIIKESVDKIYNGKKNEEDKDRKEEKKWATIPYVKGLSEKLKKI